MFKALILAVFTAILIEPFTYGQEWVVSADKQSKVSPFKFDDISRKKGQATFIQNCTSCHGIPTKGNFVALVPPPGDPATDIFQKQTDGALFYRITTGHGAMPSFKDVLTEEQRWQVISYFRSFNTKYVQPVPEIKSSGAFTGVNVNVKYEYLKQTKQIKLIASSTKNNISKPLGGITISLYAKRYFGNLLIDEAKTTNNNGEAFYDFSKVLPGDSLGRINFTIKIDAEGLDGIKADTILAIGKPNHAKSLVAGRAMWNVRSKAPFWIMFSYIFVVIGVWGILFFIIFQIRKIKKLGKNKD
jgi:hypothetical protein